MPPFIYYSTVEGKAGSAGQMKRCGQVPLRCQHMQQTNLSLTLTSLIKQYYLSAFCWENLFHSQFLSAAGIMYYGDYLRINQFYSKSWSRKKCVWALSLCTLTAVSSRISFKWQTSDNFCLQVIAIGNVQKKICVRDFHTIEISHNDLLTDTTYQCQTQECWLTAIMLSDPKSISWFKEPYHIQQQNL